MQNGKTIKTWKNVEFNVDIFTQKNKWNFLLTNVDRNDILDKLFRTTEMIEADSEKEK